MMNRFSCLVPLVLLLSFSAHAIPQSEPNRAGSVVVRPRIGNSLPGGPGLVEFNDVKRPGVALVLSGGGARGLSSIGVLKVFEENAIPIDLIVGTSIGSIVGGLYASGYSPADLEHIALTTDWGEVLSYDDDARRRDMFLDQKLATEKSILVLRFDGFEPVLPAAYSTGQRLTNFLNLLVLQSIYRPDPGFDALRVPFRAVTTDLISGRQFVYREGDLSEALRAAVSVPLLFSSVKKDSMQLMDGGLISNMPVDVALDEGMDCIIIVDVTSPLRTAGEVVAPWEVGEQIMGIMMQRSNAEAREKADVVITPPLGNHLSSDFTHIEDLIAYGEDAAYGALERIRAQLQVPMNHVNGTQYDHLRIDLSDADLAAGDAAFIEDQLASVVVNRQDIQVVIDQLHSSGMYKELSVQIEVDSSGARSNWKAVRYPVLHTVEFKGVASLPVDSLVAQFSRLLGRPLNARTSHAAIERVLGLYRTRGYSLAHIERTTFDPATGNAVLEVDEGRISRMTIKGTEKTKDYVVWRELPFGEGDVFQVSSVAEGISNIYSTNLFEQAAVEIEHEGTQNQNHVIIFNLRERATDLMRVGLKVDNERSFQPWLNVSDENFFGAGAEIGVSFAGGTRNQAIVGELMASRIFDSYLTSRLRLYMRSRDINTYDNVLGLSNNRFERTRVGEIREIRRGGSLSFGAQLERLGDVTVEGRLERIQVYNIVNQPITNQDYDISSVLFGTRIDTQDKIPYPTDGVNLNFAYETAITRSSTSVGFTKFLFSYESYKTLGQRHTISTRLMLGLGDDAVPTSEQFSLGGQQSFLGYREDNARGRQIFVGGVEYRYLLPIRIYFDTYISLKYDIGSVWLRSEEIRLVDLQHGIGVSLGFDTPIGPAQFSLGRSFITRGDLSNQPLALGPVLAYFSLGYTIE